MRQLCNPGFEDQIKVYVWSSNIVMNKVKTKYAFVKDGKTILANEKSYGEDFKALFADCPQMLEEFKTPDFQDVAFHIFVNQQVCK